MYDGRPYQVYIKSRSFLNVHHSIGLTHSWCTRYGNHLSNILVCIKRKGGCIYIYIVTRLPKQSIDHSIGRTHIWRTRNDLSRIYRGILPHQASAEILTTRTETGCVSPLIISHTR